jgi:hypothetical protein
MGDTTNFSVAARGVNNPLVLAEIRNLADNYASGCYYDVTIDKTSLRLGANDVAVGSVEEMLDDLETLIRDGMEDEDGERVTVEDFAYWVNDDPKYEWLGAIGVHVPHVGDFHGQCDADGNPVFSTKEIVEMVNTATDLDHLKAAVADKTGDAVLKAWRALEAS